MKKQLVDGLNGKHNVRQVFPVKVEVSDASFEQKAIAAAVASELMPLAQEKKPKARPHVSRGGPLMPYGDALQSKNDQKMRQEQRIRHCSYLLWQNDGCPDGRADEYWHRACQIEAPSLE